MLKKPIDVIPLAAMAVLAASLLDHLLSRGPLLQAPLADSAPFPPSQIDHGNGPGEAAGKIPEGSVSYLTGGLAWSCPNDRYAREFGEIALRQLQGRYSIGTDGHLYLKAANQEHRALLVRFFPGCADFSESWSWLVEIANFHGPETWSSSRDLSLEDKRQGVEWRGGFLLLRRVLDPITFEPKTACRLFSHSDRTWGKWHPGIVAVAADGIRKNGQWKIQWRLEAERGRFVLGNDPSVHPELAALFSEPFFLLPVTAGEIP